MGNDIHVGMSTTLQLIEICGIVAFACSGFVEARNKKMDVVGVFIVAFIAAFGGGTLRDLLMNRHPLFWIQHQEYTLLVFALSLVIIPFTRHLRSSVAEKALIVADALGLGICSAIGTSLALEAHMPLFGCVMMGVTTSIFGGILRDVICNEIPLVFRSGELYATCSFVGCWFYLLLDWLAAPQAIALIASTLFIVAMRLLSLRFNVKLPR